MVSTGNPPNLATLNFPKSESEIAMGEKFNNKKVLPNYTKNPELELEQTLLKLKGGADKNQFKKDVGVAPQKPQPVPLTGNTQTIPEQHLKKHLEDLGKKEHEQIEQSGIDKMVPPQMNCKFLNSAKCHPDYPNFSGASIQFPEGAKMKCDAAGNEKPAKAVCTINNGAINGVYVIDGGEGHGENPNVQAIGGGGEGAQFKAKVSGGKITEIVVVNGGKGFHETPVIKIEQPNLSQGCYLCCK